MFNREGQLEGRGEERKRDIGTGRGWGIGKNEVSREKWWHRNSAGGRGKKGKG